MGKFICSDVESGLQGFDNVFDISELVSGDLPGGDNFVDTSNVSVL